MNGDAANPPGFNTQSEGWPRQRLIFFITIFFAVQLGFIFFFGTKKGILPRPVKNVPQLQLADNSSGLVGLDDPTLFALPHANDFISAVWLQTPAVAPPDFRWTEPPRWLPPDIEKLGATFNAFMATNHFAEFQINFKPEPKLSEPLSPEDSGLPQNSMLRIFGRLAHRPLLVQPALPSLPYNDVILPSKVQVLVDAAGNVASVVLLENSGLDAADQNALKIARSLRFAPAAQLTFGEIIFIWHTVPLATTNAP